MKTITSMTTADDDLLNNAQFDPVFDSEGNLVDIVHLEVTTDRSRGIKAMLELSKTQEPHDEIITNTGWTQKQKRILNSAAPGAAHTIKRSKRWDAAQGAFVPTATLILPFEVVWVLFEEVFGGDYSIEIKDILHESEDVVSSGVQGGRDLPGRIFYARARVAITVHLSNGQQRTFEGIGVAYDTVKMEMTGNVFAINSARRTAEKGAVSDAKREALANVGRVFRRAFEDGAEALKAIEEKLMEKMLSNNPRRAAAAQKVSAPKAVPRAPQEDDTSYDVIPGDYMPMDAMEEKSGPKNTKKETDQGKAPGKKETAKETSDKKSEEGQKETPDDPKTDQKKDVPEKSVKTKQEKKPFILKILDTQEAIETPQAVYDLAISHLDTLEDAQAQKSFLEMNKSTLLEAEEADEIGDLNYQDLLEMVEVSGEGDAQEPEQEEKEEEDEAPQNPAFKLSPDKMTGEAILKAYETAFSRAKTAKDIEQILDQNTDLARRLTKRQKLTLTQMTLDAQKK